MKQPLIVSINTPKALMGSLGNLSPKVFDSFFLDDPIHIASVLVQLIFRPEICNKYFNRLRNSEAEYSSANTAVVLFAYCSSLVSLLPMEIPLTFEFCLIETANTSAAGTNRHGESRSPCLRPLSRRKLSDKRSLLITQL